MRLARKDLQGRKGQLGLRDPREPLERLDPKVLKASRVMLVLKDLPGQRDPLDRRDLPDLWVQPVKQARLEH